MSDAIIIVTPHYFLYNETKIYQLRLQGVNNSAVGCLYCKNNQTYSRASNMNKIQLEGLLQVKKIVTHRHKTRVDIAPILSSHEWQAYYTDDMKG